MPTSFFEVFVSLFAGDAIMTYAGSKAVILHEFVTVNVAGLIPNSATSDEIDFIMQSQDCLQSNPLDVTRKGLGTGIEMYKKSPTPVKVLVIVLSVFFFLIVAPLMAYVIFMVYVNKIDLARCLALMVVAAMVWLLRIFFL